MMTALLGLGIGVVCWLWVKSASTTAPQDLDLRAQNAWLEKQTASIHFVGNLGYLACAVAAVRLAFIILGVGGGE